MLNTSNLGFTRIGEKRELKKALELFWKGDISKAELVEVGKTLRAQNWEKQRKAGITSIPSNDFSFYDQMLDMSCLLGNIPERFHFSGDTVGLETMFLVARGTVPGVSKGKEDAHTHGGSCGCEATAGEMTKWFDTNYHFIVPELAPTSKFKLSGTKPFDEFSEAKALGIVTRPVIIGPLTYLLLGKLHGDVPAGFSKLSLLESLLPVYGEVLARLEALGAEWIQIDEPCLALDLSDEERTAFQAAYKVLASKVTKTKLLVATYFGELRENLTTLATLPVAGVHIDATRAGAEVEQLAQALPSTSVLSVGVVDGRNIWKANLDNALSIVAKVASIRGANSVQVSPSCSLIHSPVTLRNENKIDAELKSWLAFAEEKLVEVVCVARAAAGDIDEAAFAASRKASERGKTSTRITNPAVRERMAKVKTTDYERGVKFAERQKAQHTRFGLPLLPTTTIGSFPQTKEVREKRAAFKRGDITSSDYDVFLAAETASAVKFQEDIGIDMLVHGEFERNDMVEYFGEQLDGYAFTQNGWVQSYGSRYVKPPIVFGDVSRPAPMTVRWSGYAQSLTTKPMKGMLSGPITMLQWSFVRDDIPRSETAKQIALALRDEVVDLEAAGIAAIQIDEPALREGLPLRRSDWAAYLDWAVAAFKLSAAGVRNDTQIHTHMCYAEFNDIIAAIAALDADVISIETSRSQMELIGAFVDFKYPNEVGPGVYDIHSPRVPTVDEMVSLLHKAANVLPVENLWVNPDCGLKTRTWDEVKPALCAMVDAARTLRDAYGSDKAANS